MPVEIKKDIYWVGAVDYNVRNFHGYTYHTSRGTSYNAYLIKGEKTALVDTVYAPFSSEMIFRIGEIVDPAKIDYVVANHVETDHSGALPDILRLCPKAKVLGTAKCKEGLWKHYYGNWDFQVVKSGDRISLGRRTLVFLETPMIHWPDSMFTYCPEEELLLSNDAFGQHYASSRRFDDEVDQAELMDEAKKYYANILWPLSSIILKKLEEVQKSAIAIKMIAPSHGVIWRREPAKIVNAYASWVKNESRPKAVVAYETMWGATDRMARAIAEGIISAGKEVKLFDLNRCDHTEVIKEMFDARGYLVGSSTHDNGMLPAAAGFLQMLKGLKPQGRIAAAFGSFGWAGGAVREIEEGLKQAGMEVRQQGLGIKYVPDPGELKKCLGFGEEFARSL